MNIRDVENLAELSRLELSTDEKQSLLEDLESILAYVKVIESVQVDDSLPEYNLYNTWREDTQRVGDDFSKELIIDQFPNSRDGFLKVKKMEKH